MLDYEWGMGNPSTIMLAGNEEPSQESDQTARQFFDHYGLSPENFVSPPTPTTEPASFSHLQQFNPQAQSNNHSFFDPRALSDASTTYTSHAPAPPNHHSLLSLDPLPPTTNGPGLLLIPKTEYVGRPMDFSASRIGLNLGGRTYFSSEDDFITRLYRRSRPGEPGSTSVNIPRCQAEGCNADLTHAKHYHRRHKVCEFHSKAATVVAAGLTQRFCQQCSRFHLLSEFDNGKRSCRKRLADHNRRRRKSNQSIQESQKIPLDNSKNSSMDNAAKSPSDSGGAYSSSSMTVAALPMDYFSQKPYQSTSNCSATSSSPFFSSG